MNCEQTLHRLYEAIREADAKAIRKEDATTGDVSFYTLASGLWHRILGIMAAAPTSCDSASVAATERNMLLGRIRELEVMLEHIRLSAGEILDDQP